MRTFLTSLTIAALVGLALTPAFIGASKRMVASEPTVGMITPGGVISGRPETNFEKITLAWLDATPEN